MPSQFLRRTLLTGAAAVALTFSAAALPLSFQWGAGESVKGSGTSAREARDASGFEAVRVAGPFQVVLRQQPAHRVSLEGDGNLLSYVETRVVDGNKGKVLEVGVKRGYQLKSSQALKVEIDLPTLRAVVLAGSGQAQLGPMKAGVLDLSVTGSGNVKASQLQADKLSINVTGSGDVVADGRSAELGVSITGSGDVQLADFVADEVKVSISGSGDAAVQANRKLKVSIAGSGDVRYRGDAELTSSIAGAGTVRKF